MNMPRIGQCDNPHTKSGKLVPNIYFLSLNGGAQAFKKKVPLMTSIEIQFLLYDEIPQSAQPYQDYVAGMRKLGVEFVAHAPFMEDKNKQGQDAKPFFVDYVWPVVPKRYQKEPVKPGDFPNHAKKAPIEPMKRLINILGTLRIPILTMHVTRSGSVLSDQEWQQYLAYLRELLPVAMKAGVTISVENGGTTDQQIMQAIAAGCKTTFDPAHYFLDMRALGKTVAEANALTLAAFQRVCKDVAVLHLSQPSDASDAHMTTLDPKGALTCNDAILKHIRTHDGVQFITLETSPDPDAITHIHKVLNA